MPTTEEYLAMLTAARAALHKLLIGSGVETVDYQGRRVTYTKTDIGALRAYIRELENLSGEKTSGRSKAILPRF